MSELYKPTVGKSVDDLPLIEMYSTSNYLKRGYTPYNTFSVDLIKHMTNKAFLLYGVNEDFWLPKSQLKRDISSTIIFVPLWLCEKNGITQRQIYLVKKN